MSKTPPQPQAGEHAKCSPFVMYIVEKRANLDKRNRVIAEKKITDIIYEIEIDSPEMINVVTTPRQPQTPKMDFMPRQSSIIYVNDEGQQCTVYGTIDYKIVLLSE